MTPRLAALVPFAVLALCAPAFSSPAILGSIYQDSASKRCASTTRCVLRFTRIPPTQAFVVQQVSCTLLDDGGVARLAQLSSARGSDSFGQAGLPLLLTDQPAPGGQEQNHASGTGPFVIFGGLTPIVTLETDAATKMFLQCTISGSIRQN